MYSFLSHNSTTEKFEPPKTLSTRTPLASFSRSTVVHTHSRALHSAPLSLPPPRTTHTAHNSAVCRPLLVSTKQRLLPSSRIPLSSVTCLPLSLSGRASSHDSWLSGSSRYQGKRCNVTLLPPQGYSSRVAPRYSASLSRWTTIIFALGCR